MKDKFFEYFQPSKAEFDAIWGKCHFSFDASVLLDLYRFSSTGREELLAAIKAVRDRVWITHQAAFEFNKHRLSIMANAHLRTDKMIQRLHETAALIDTECSQHPYLDESTLRPIYKQLKEAVETVQTVKSQSPTDDPLGDELLELLNGRVGDPYSSEKLTELHLEIDKRYEDKTPPGYMDLAEKKKPGNSGDPYGDCLLWFQLIDHARENKVPVVFISRDRKEDWWTKIHGRTVQPRHELRREFRDKSSEHFYLYETPQFIQFLKLSPKLFKEAENLSAESANELVQDNASSPDLLGVSSDSATFGISPDIWASFIRNLLTNASNSSKKSSLGGTLLTEPRDTESKDNSASPSLNSANASYDGGSPPMDFDKGNSDG